ncbi:hypothetical protein HNQ07_001440 [Deinococcus metalli]|uniref:Uncharacterized protein n=1 Tax=Deinococcus metalli TaxID=1141878 RepID=A0A7W8KF63_9DEIO|nr:DUF6157 family protein [Deinococcus metalli]MBB5375983.1 hypothetical protein [Deinococcus metalli]GHF41687.1 hypothetical protein GCM10017781_18010 [Deinococcus metalli]
MSALTGYHDTLIATAPDSAATGGVVPARGVAAYQYALLCARPFSLTQADVLFLTAHRDTPGDPADVRAVRWDAFFAQPRACLRASPLPKTHGWGLHFDARGRVALVDSAAPEYRRLMDDPHTRVVPALRSARPRSEP